jgi:DUF1680 family protein
MTQHTPTPDPTAAPRQPLPNALAPLPLGAIRPAGWLREQLRTQAAGLSGHLAEHWPDVADSAWIGGSAEGWERAPYWLDGTVPLAFLLDDARLLATVTRFIDTILARQGEDGWLGPLRDTSDGRRKNYDPWPVFVLLKALTQFHEASGDARIIPAITRFLRRLDTLLDEQPLFDWGRYRWADLAVSLLWLYERTNEPWLLALAAKSYRQTFDWGALFRNYPYATKQPIERIHPPAPPEPGVTFRTDLASHVVNNAMALKQPALWYRLAHDPADRAAVQHMIDTLDRYHGQVTGVFSGDEHLAGVSPSQGTELCAVVEYMYALEVLLAALGDAALVDRLERIAFNALPATFTPDMWAHQYVQQANQVECRVMPDRGVYTNNRGDANIFGLEPQYGCCTANMHQGWPKFVSHLWMRSPDGGMAAISYAPCMLATDVNGTSVRLEVNTDYPFGETITISVMVGHPARFPLHLRVPGWAEVATVAVANEQPDPMQPGGFHQVEREWAGTTAVVLHLPMRVELLRRSQGAVAVKRGPLLFALPVAAEWRNVREWGWEGVAGDFANADWELYPAQAWNYAMVLDPEQTFEPVVETQPAGGSPFSGESAPVRLRVRGRRVPNWGMEQGAAAPPPPSPVTTEGPHEELTLIPYGCARLRITEFPVTH